MFTSLQVYIKQTRFHAYSIICYTFILFQYCSTYYYLFIQQHFSIIFQKLVLKCQRKLIVVILGFDYIFTIPFYFALLSSWCHETAMAWGYTGENWPGKQCSYSGQDADSDSHVLAGSLQIFLTVSWLNWWEISGD